jgi:uncharacterized DUF497 family protein
MDILARVLLVVFTWREQETLHVIYARKAMRQERRDYEEGYA